MTMMSEEYRRRSIEAITKSEEATDLELARHWLECAVSWRRMADAAVRMERESIVDSRRAVPVQDL